MNPQHAALLTMHAKQKICQMIVQSRVAFPESEPRSTNKWFNLGTDDLSSLKSQLEVVLKRTTTASLHLDIMMSSGVGGSRQHVLLERWTLLHGDSAGGTNSGGVVVALDGAATSAMHDRLVLLLRNLRAQLRQLPAAVIFRSAASQFPDQTPRAIYYVVHPMVTAGSGGGSGAAEAAAASTVASGQAPAMAAWESPPHLLSFAQVQTSVGRLRVSVEFRRDVESLLATEPVIQPIAVISDYVNRNVDVQINVLVDYIPKESSVPRRASVSSISALSNAIGSSSSPASKFSSGAALSAAGVNGHDQSQSVMGPSQSFQSQSAGLVLQQQQQQSFPKTSSSLGSNSLSAFENQHSASSRPVVPMSVFVSAPVKGRVTGFAPPVLSPDSQLHQQQIVLPQAHESSPASQTSPNFAAFSSPFPSAPSAFGSPSLQPQANPQSLLSSALSSAINGDQSAVDYFSAPSGQHSTQQQAVKYPNQHRESIGSASNGVPPRHPPPFVSGTPPSPMLSARTPPQAINQPVSHGSSSSQQPQHHLFQSSAQTSSASPHLLPSMLPTSSASSVAAGFMLPSNVMTSLSSSPSSFSGASHQQHLLQQHQQQQQQQRLQHQQSSGYTHPLPPLPPVSHSPAVSRPLSPVFATGSPSGMRRISSQEAMGLVSVGSASNLSSSPLITNPLGPGAISAPRSQRRGSSSSNSKAQEAPPFVASGQVPHSQPASFQPQFLSPPPSQQNSSHSSSAISFGTTPPSPVLMAFQQSNHNLATVSEFNGFTALPASASFSNSADYARGQASVPLSINQQSTASSTRRHQRADSMVSSGAGSLPTGSFPGSSHMLSFASHATAPASRSLNDFTLPPHSSLHHDLPRLLPAERPVSVTDLLGAVPLERTVDDDDDGPSFADASFGRAAGVGGAEPHAELGALISLLRVPSCTLNIFRHNSSSTRSMNSGGPPLVERVGKILDNLDRLNARFQSFI